MGTPSLPATESNGILLRRVRVVLVSPSHPGNVGSAARAMKTMGLGDLVLVSPRDEGVCLSAEANALASGAADVLEGARVVPTLAEALADVHFALAFTSRRRELSHRPMDVRSASAAMVAEIQSNQDARGALVFGSESFGLSNEEVDRCQAIATIPANPDYSSLNLSHAVQLATYELRVTSGAAATLPEGARITANVGAVDGFLDQLELAAVQSGFLDPASPKRFATRMRRLFTRARLEPEEVAILRGLLAALLSDKKRRL